MVSVSGLLVARPTPALFPVAPTTVPLKLASGGFSALNKLLAMHLLANPEQYIDSFN